MTEISGIELTLCSEDHEYRITILLDNGEAIKHTTMVHSPLTSIRDGDRYKIPLDLDAIDEDHRLYGLSWPRLLDAEAVVSDDETTVSGQIVGYNDLEHTFTVEDAT